MRVRTAQELKPDDTVTNILTGSTVNRANLSQFVIYENPCAPKVSKSEISYALIGLRRGSLTDKTRKHIAQAVFGVLDKRVLPEEWLILPKNQGWAEKSGLVLWKDNRYWPCKHWNPAVEEANDLVWVKDGSRQYYSSRLFIRDNSFHYDPVTKTLERKAKSSSTEVKHRFSANRDAYLQKRRGGYEERSKSEPADPRAGVKPLGSRIRFSRAQSVTPGEVQGPHQGSRTVHQNHQVQRSTFLTTLRFSNLPSRKPVAKHQLNVPYLRVQVQRILLRIIHQDPCRKVPVQIDLKRSTLR